MKFHAPTFGGFHAQLFRILRFGKPTGTMRCSTWSSTCWPRSSTLRRCCCSFRPAPAAGPVKPVNVTCSALEQGRVGGTFNGSYSPDRSERTHGCLAGVGIAIVAVFLFRTFPAGRGGHLPSATTSFRTSVPPSMTDAGTPLRYHSGERRALLCAGANDMHVMEYSVMFYTRWSSVNPSPSCCSGDHDRHRAAAHARRINLLPISGLGDRISKSLKRRASGQEKSTDLLARGGDLDRHPIEAFHGRRT